MAENGADEAQAPQIRMNVLTQYIRDLSFENILSQKGTNGEVTPDVQVQVNLDARKRAADHQFRRSFHSLLQGSNVAWRGKVFILCGNSYFSYIVFRVQFVKHQSYELFGRRSTGGDSNCS
mgnify:CR=1 FL=1